MIFNPGGGAAGGIKTHRGEIPSPPYGTLEQTYIIPFKASVLFAGTGLDLEIVLLGETKSIPGPRDDFTFSADGRTLTLTRGRSDSQDSLPFVALG